MKTISASNFHGDGLQDLILAHSRKPDPRLPNFGGEGFEGRFIRILINAGDRRFVDETAGRMGDQSRTTPVTRAEDGGTLLNAVQRLLALDVNQDGHPDLVMGDSQHRGIDDEGPLVHLNDGLGRFTVLDPDLFSNGELFFGEGSVPIDVNGDGVLDYVHTDALAGADGLFGTTDDLSDIVTLVAAPVP